MRLPISQPSNLLRSRSGHDASRVSNIELFFDLVFVFAITQLSHALLEHLTIRGVLEVTILLMATWWVWMYTTWATNWINPERTPVRVLLVGLMFAGLLLSTSIPHAFDDTGLIFAIAYIVSQIGRTVFLVWSFQGTSAQVTMTRIVAWFVVSAPFWIVGGLVDGDLRFVLWAIALVIDYLAPSQGYRFPGLGVSTTSDWSISGSHMAERCGLFVIIALGESILVSGATYAGLDRTTISTSAFVTAFLGSVVMWWIYFGTVAERASRQFEAADDPGRIGRLAYTYLHLPIVAGIIVVAVGDELVLAHPEGHSDLETVLTVLGGPAVFLLGTFLFKLVSSLGRVPVSHIVGFALLLVLVPFAEDISPLWLSWITTAVLVVVGLWESLAGRNTPEVSPEPAG